MESKINDLIDNKIEEILELEEKAYRKNNILMVNEKKMKMCEF